MWTKKEYGGMGYGERLIQGEILLTFDWRHLLCTYFLKRGIFKLPYLNIIFKTFSFIPTPVSIFILVIWGRYTEKTWKSWQWFVLICNSSRDHLITMKNKDFLQFVPNTHSPETLPIYVQKITNVHNTNLNFIIFNKLHLGIVHKQFLYLPDIRLTRAWFS